MVPFFKDVGCHNWAYSILFWRIFVIVGTGNAVNLTDGLDGLAMPTVFVAGAFAHCLGDR